MTESQYLSWIRSALRSKSLRWMPRVEALKLARRSYKGPNKLQKYEYKCSLCQNWFKLKECQVDHYPKPAGSILSVDDIGEFANNLFCETDNLRVLCATCHSAHTLSERQGITFEEAKFQKLVIQKMKEPSRKLLDWLLSYGYNEQECSNTVKRKKLVEEILKGECY